MCGRLNLSDLDGIRRMMADIGMPLFDIDQHQPCFNIAPTSHLQVLTSQTQNDGTAQPMWQQMHWGMPLANGPLVINARSETANSKPTFKNILQQRALVPVTGFYEWQRRNKERHAWFFQAENEQGLALAAIWRLADQGPQLALLTTEADSNMAPIHHRMPVAVGSADALSWLTGKTALIPAAQRLRKRQVNNWVDNAKHQGPQCIAKPEALPYTPDLFD